MCRPTWPGPATKQTSGSPDLWAICKQAARLGTLGAFEAGRLPTGNCCLLLPRPKSLDRKTQGTQKRRCTFSQTVTAKGGGKGGWTDNSNPQVTQAGLDPPGELFLFFKVEPLCILSIQRGSEQASKPPLARADPGGKGGVLAALPPSPRGDPTSVRHIHTPRRSLP